MKKRDKKTGRMLPTHGLSKTPTYRSWSHMMWRCYGKDPHHQRYYRDRGITVHERWHDFMLFLEDMGERPLGKTIDREDNDKGYSPENCRWATREEQLKNRRMQYNNNSGVAGVRWCEIKKRWIAYHKDRTLKTTKNFNEAVKARRDAEDDYRNRKTQS